MRSFLMMFPYKFLVLPFILSKTCRKKLLSLLSKFKMITGEKGENQHILKLETKSEKVKAQPSSSIPLRIVVLRALQFWFRSAWNGFRDPGTKRTTPPERIQLMNVQHEQSRSRGLLCKDRSVGVTQPAIATAIATIVEFRVTCVAHTCQTRLRSEVRNPLLEG
jgi:hypothetical protein